MLELLPKNIIIYIFKYLKLKELCGIVCLNKFIYNICMSPQLKIYKYKSHNMRKILYKQIFSYYNPAMIEEIYLHNTFIDKFPNINILPRLKCLKLRNSNITYIPKINSTSLKKIEIIEHHINYLEDISGIVNLMKLTIEEGVLETFPEITNLKHLKYLNLISNNISYIPAICSDSLECLYLGYNKLYKAPNIIGATKLESLSLFGNYISDISDIKSDSLLNLYIQNNGIESINSISNMKNLIYLGLGDNKIKYLNNLISTSLYELNVENNGLIEFKNNLFPALRFLNLGINQLEYISFAGIENVEKALLKDNKITTISSSTNKKLKIKILSLKNNFLGNNFLENNFLGNNNKNICISGIPSKCYIDIFDK